MSLRDLPSVDGLARRLPDSIPERLRVAIARQLLDEARERVRDGDEFDVDDLVQAAISNPAAQRPTPVINATGVILHTNLGRAPLDAVAAHAALTAGSGYGNLEFDLATGQRGGRTAYLDALLTTITGAEAAMVVNNNAGALFLVLTALASGGSVPVSRGELIEIGGSYRLPELMASAGTRLVEVGTTNRTRVEDHARAIDDSTRLLLKVHPSNYRIEGFSASVTIPELVALGHDRELPVVHDAGSGLIDERLPWQAGPPPSWLADEPGIVQSVTDGADLTMFSGDKLFGGPQAGIIVGRADLVGLLRRHPVARAMRVDGPTIAALVATAERYADGSAAELPLWTMALMDEGTLRSRSEAVAVAVPNATVADGWSTIGAGSAPGSRIPGPIVQLPGEADEIYDRLLAHDPPVVARRAEGRCVIDLRTVAPAMDPTVGAAITAACLS